MNDYRTYLCSQMGKETKLAGWIDKIRDLGWVLFIDLRDQYGITQVVVRCNEELVAKIPIESTESISGVIRKETKRQ